MGLRCFWLWRSCSVAMTDFASDLEMAAETAQLAPSSHNCQPWALCWLNSTAARTEARHAISGEGEYLVLALDHARALTALPAHRFEMAISCGGYWQLLIRALATRGWVVRQTRYDVTDHAFGTQWPTRFEPLALARFVRGRADPAATVSLAEEATQRRTARGPYADSAPGPEALKSLAAAVRTPNDRLCDAIGVRHLCRPNDLATVATLTRRYAARDFSRTDVWRETHSYIRWTDASALIQADGFTPAQLFGLTGGWRLWAKRVALAPGVMRVLQLLDYPATLADQLATLVGRGPMVTVLSLPCRVVAPDVELAAGRALLEYWLAATRHGVGLHPISVLVQHPDSRTALADLLGITGRPYFVARLGYPQHRSGVSLRRPAIAHRHVL